jgi:5'-3' exonuclease
MLRRGCTMRVHLIDGTYELFRHYFAVPPHKDQSGMDVGALRGVVGSMLNLLDSGATHVGVATDHVVESFRNELYPGYKTGEGIEPALRAQFEPLEEALDALGVAVWPMVEFEADDALATGALLYRDAPGVEQVVLCSPDKDLSQCVVGTRVICRDRRKRQDRDEDGVVARFGVRPPSIPDWLALVGDTADGIPGVPGWGEKSASAVLAAHGHIERIPDEASQWRADVRGRDRLAASLAGHRKEAYLDRDLATVRTDVPIAESLADLEWRGARRDELATLCDAIGAPEIVDRVRRWA